MAKKVVFKMPPTGDPVKGAAKAETLNPGRGPIESRLDIRDRIYELLGGGMDMSQMDKNAVYSDLADMIGPEKAQKVFVQTAMFGSHPEHRALPIENRIQLFYDIGSNDPDVKQILDQTRNLGYGLKHGFRTSSSQLNQELAGRIEPRPASIDIGDGKRRTMFKVKK